MTSESQAANNDDTTPVVTRQERGRRVKDIDALTKADKERLAKRGITPVTVQERERIILQLLEAEQENNGALYHTGLRNQAARQLKVSVWTIDRWKEQYQTNPRPESLIEAKRGPKAGSRMPMEQEAIICYFYLFEKQKILGPDGYTVELKRRADARYIHRILEKFVGFTKSEDTVRRYLAKLHITNPVVVKLARFGKKFLADRIIPTLPNNVERPNIRWQIDGRPLPIYIRYKGMICTVTLLVIMDDYSQYIVRAGLYPRMILNDEGLPQRADFRKEDVGVLLASAMYHWQVRPESLYTDNGTQFFALAELLRDLSDENEVLTRMTKSIPGRPRGRGKLEHLLGLFDELLKDTPAFVKAEECESEFTAINSAKQDPEMLDFELLCTFVQGEVDKLNKEPSRKNGLRTREELWRETESLPAPDVRRLLRLVPESRSQDRAIYKNGFLLDNDWYEPRIESDEDMYQWMVAVARGEHVPMRAVKLSEPLYRQKGDKGWRVEVCLDREIPYWIEGVPQGSQNLGVAKYNEMIARAKKRGRQELEGQLVALLPLIESFNAQDLMKDLFTKEPLLPEEIAPPTDLTVKPVVPIAPEDQSIAPRRSTPRRNNNRKASGKESPPTESGTNWDEMPKFEELT